MYHQKETDKQAQTLQKFCLLLHFKNWEGTKTQIVKNPTKPYAGGTKMSDWEMPKHIFR